ncbi:MAG: hypothetical protein HZB38_00390 [Planctomycetes bacterium]|nr:hypothetical protein [Planctomycetota bacterium]
MIGRFSDGGDRPKLTVRYAGTVVGEIELKFLHEGLPKPRRAAHWKPLENLAGRGTVAKPAPDVSPIERLLTALAAPSAASKDWIIRRYDHEVQGGSVVKPHVGRGRGPSDAAVLRPLLTSHRGIAIGCGLAPQLSDLDPYWMAIAAIDEALCNITAVGADPRQAALLDNFCWGRTDDPQQMGALVRACQACYDGAKAFGAPFISGKDSLNNEFALDPGDIDSLVSELRLQMSDLRKWGYPQKLAEYRIDRSVGFRSVGPPSPTMGSPSDSEVRRYEMRDGTSEPQAQARGAESPSDSEVRRYESGTPLNHEALLAAVERRIRETGRLGIPPTLLISAIALVDDVRRCVTSDLKTPGGAVCLVGGLPVSGFDLAQSHAVRCAVRDAIAAGVVAAVHDACGGWLPAAAEMAIAGARGLRIDAATDGAFEPQCAAFVVELRAGVEPDALKRFGQNVAVSRIGTTAVDDQGVFSIGPRETSVADLPYRGPSLARRARMASARVTSLRRRRTCRFRSNPCG